MRKDIGPGLLLVTLIVCLLGGAITFYLGYLLGLFPSCARNGTC